MKNELEKRLKEAELVIFDLDGTLVDSNGSSNEIDVKLARMLGEKKSDEEIIEERDEFFETTGFEGDIYEKYCKYLKEKYTSNLSAEEIRNTRRKMLREASKNIKFKPNADELIKYLKNQNKKLGLATVSRQETIDIYASENKYMKDKCNLKEYFDYIVTKDDVKNKKPNPEVYNKIVNKFGIKDLTKCIVIEDSLTGVKAAKSANLYTIVVYDKYSDKNREKINELSDYQVKDFNELIDLFKNV